MRVVFGVGVFGCSQRNRLDTTFQEAIRMHVRPGSRIWTDSHKSYDWLSAWGEYKHEEVNAGYVKMSSLYPFLFALGLGQT